MDGTETFRRPPEERVDIVEQRNPKSSLTRLNVTDQGGHSNQIPSISAQNASNQAFGSNRLTNNSFKAFPSNSRATTGNSEMYNNHDTNNVSGPHSSNWRLQDHIQAVMQDANVSRERPHKYESIEQERKHEEIRKSSWRDNRDVMGVSTDSIVTLDTDDTLVPVYVPRAVESWLRSTRESQDGDGSMAANNPWAKDGIMSRDGRLEQDVKAPEACHTCINLRKLKC